METMPKHNSKSNLRVLNIALGLIAAPLIIIMIEAVYMHYLSRVRTSDEYAPHVPLANLEKHAPHDNKAYDYKALFALIKKTNTFEKELRHQKETLLKNESIKKQIRLLVQEWEKQKKVFSEYYEHIQHHYFSQQSSAPLYSFFLLYADKKRSEHPSIPLKLNRRLAYTRRVIDQRYTQTHNWHTFFEKHIQTNKK